MQIREYPLAERVALWVRTVQRGAPGIAIIDVCINVREELFGREWDALQLLELQVHTDEVLPRQTAHVFLRILAE